MNTEKAVLAWRRKENQKADPTQRYLCKGGPFDEQYIVLCVAGDGYTLPVCVNNECGRYKRLALGNPKARIPGTVEWVPSTP